MKKLLLSLGTLAAVVAPVASVVACGSSKTTTADKALSSAKTAAIAKLKKDLTGDALEAALKAVDGAKDLTALAALVEKADPKSTEGTPTSVPTATQVGASELTASTLTTEAIANRKEAKTQLVSNLEATTDAVVKTKITSDQADVFLAKVKAMGGTFLDGKGKADNGEALKTKLMTLTLDQLTLFKTAQFVKLPTTVTDESSAAKALEATGDKTATSVIGQVLVTTSNVLSLDEVKKATISGLSTFNLSDTDKKAIIDLIKNANDVKTVEEIVKSNPIMLKAIAIMTKPSLKTLTYGGTFNTGSEQFALTSLNGWAFVSTTKDGKTVARTFVVPQASIETVNGKTTIKDTAFQAELKRLDLEFLSVTSNFEWATIITTNTAGQTSINSGQFAEVWLLSGVDKGVNFKDVMKQQLSDPAKADDTKLTALYNDIKDSYSSKR